MTEPLGPQSLTWQYAGDWRALLTALCAGTLQTMHPAIAAAVEEHSGFFDERWQRLLRSLYPIGGVVYDGPAAGTSGRSLRRFHDPIAGTDRRGTRYHALEPKIFYWAHATFYMSVVQTAEYFGHRLSESDHDRLYAEHVRWYRMYGLTTRPVPADRADFRRYWLRMCGDVLEPTTAARCVLDIAALDRPPALRWLPSPLWALMWFPIGRGYRWITVGLFPELVRERLGYRWTRRDERLLRLFGRLVHHCWRLVPRRLRFHPRAWAGWQRAAGRIPPDTPPVESPARYAGRSRPQTSTRG